MQFDFHTRELTIKLVYYGPALSGKTTNLEALHKLIPDPTVCGKLKTLDTQDDRTLFFDLLPLAIRLGSGPSVRIKVFTVPGQVIHGSTRRLVLQGVDGLVFVADSRNAEKKNNKASFDDLQANLKTNKVEIGSLPLVIQFNKRDMPDIQSDAEIDALAKRGREPVFKAVAIRGDGVLETFLGLLSITWRRLDATHKFQEKFRIEPRELLQAIADRLGAPPSFVSGAIR